MHTFKSILPLVLIAAQSATAQSVVQCENYCIAYETNLLDSNAVAGWVNGVRINVKAPGSAMSPKILEYMCDDGYTLACILQPCGGSYLATNKIKWSLLLSWATVCNTKKISGDSRAIACWESKIAKNCNEIPPPP